MQMRQSEQKLIEILIELFGMTSCDKIASCYEYSKISAVIGFWSSPLPEMRLMRKDLERPQDVYKRQQYMCKAFLVAGSILIKG